MYQPIKTSSFVPVMPVAVIAVTAFVCFVDRGQRKILVNYAKRQVGNKVYGGQSSHLPLKLNMSGVIPPIFASSIILFPATLAGWFGSSDGMNWLKDHHRRWQPAALAVFTFGLLLPLSEMIRLHPYEYTHFNHLVGTVRGADTIFLQLSGYGASAHFPPAGSSRPRRSKNCRRYSRRRSAAANCAR